MNFPSLNFFLGSSCSPPTTSDSSSTTNHVDTDTEDYLLDDPTGTILSSSSVGYNQEFMMDNHGFYDDGDEDEDEEEEVDEDEEDYDEGISIGGVNKKRTVGNGAKRKRSAFSKAAQISERLQNESFSGTFADEDIHWDPNNGLPHAGKWPIEEERYAYMLIRNFENGTLDDCEDGTTLRSYLAKTLQCAPMRVSKKFAGKCIGSKTFVRRQGDGNHDSFDSTSGSMDTKTTDALPSSLEIHGSNVNSGSNCNRKLTIKAPTIVVSNKYGLRKNAVRSYDEYDDDVDDDDELSSTSGEDASSGSSSDSGTSDGSGSPRSDGSNSPPSNNHSRNKRQRNNMDINNTIVRNVTSASIRRKPSYPQSSHSFGGNSSNKSDGNYSMNDAIFNLGGIDPDHDEWGQALSYFFTTDFPGINGGLKRTQSTLSFSLLG